MATALRHWGWRAALLAALCVASSPAFAQQDPPPDPAAVALFDTGRAWMATSHYEEAIAKFEESLKITRSVGALLNLAECYEQIGKKASAWTNFRGAEAAARDAKDAARQRVAHDRAAALETKLVKLTIVVSREANFPNLVLKRDGSLIPTSELNAAIPVDPGSHVVEASAAGMKPWSQTTTVAKTDVTITVPVLDASSPPSLAGEGAGPATMTSDASALSSQKVIGLVVAGAGVASIALGGVAGLVAISDHNSAVAACASYPNHCPSDHGADDPNGQSQTWAAVSTVAFIAGGALAATGAVLFFTAKPTASKSDPRPVREMRLTPWVGSQGGSVLLEGRWW